MNEEIRFITSGLEPATWPQLLDPRGKPLPEIALAGRSNVGKSTFLNVLSGRKTLAKISSTPGKTQRIQFFSTSELAIVDLPGFGFAKAPPALQAEWSHAIDQYLNQRSALCLVLLFLDIRREPSEEDLTLLAWAKAKPIPLLPVFTKTDMMDTATVKCRKEKISATLDMSDQILKAISVPAPRRNLWSILRKNYETK